jgi:Rho-binding antiterminator
MKIGDIIECTALDTQYNASREECIKVNVKGVAKELVLSEISKIEACVENPFFKEIFIA